MPSQIGSKPIMNNTGATIGTTTKVISIKSRIKPNKNITNITISVAPITPPGMSSNKLNTSSSPPKPLKTNENKLAPIRIINTIDVILVVLCITAVKFFRVSCFCHNANNVAPIAPIPAASVGVAKPKSIEPKTTNINNKGGINAFIIKLNIVRPWAISFMSALLKRGTLSGLRFATIKQ